MARVIIASPADADTAVILDDLAANAGVVTASRYAARFDRLLDRLADYPAIGPRRPALGQDIRIGIIAPYIVIYAYDAGADTVTVLRIVHGRREITAQILSAPR
jgi:toxin ParE1/3/4